MRVSSIFFAVMLLAAWSAQAADIVVALRSDAVIHASTYRVGDIATVTADDVLAAGKLHDMEMGVAPRPGHSERLTQQQVMRFIEVHMPESRRKLQMAGSQTINVHTTGIALDKERAQQLAMAVLRSALGAGYERVEIKQVAPLREMVLPADAEFRPRSLRGPITRRTAVWIDIQAAGRPYAAIPVWFSVHAWKRVPVALRELAAGSAVHPEDFEYSTCDIMQHTGVVDRLPPKSRLRTALAAGMPIMAGAIEALPEISRNQEVAVRVEAGNIVIETAGVAQADGRTGDVVRVKNAGSSEIFLARVLEPGVVAVNAR